MARTSEATELLRSWLATWERTLQSEKLDVCAHKTRIFLERLAEPVEAADCPGCGQRVRVIPFVPDRYEPHAIGFAVGWCELSGKEVRSCSV